MTTPDVVQFLAGTLTLLVRSFDVSPEHLRAKMAALVGSDEFWEVLADEDTLDGARVAAAVALIEKKRSREGGS